MVDSPLPKNPPKKFFDFIENPSAYRPEDDPQSEALASYPTAKPLFPQIKNFPLINEIVYAFSAPSLESVTATSAKNYYYISPQLKYFILFYSILLLY